MAYHGLMWLDIRDLGLETLLPTVVHYYSPRPYFRKGLKWALGRLIWAKRHVLPQL